MKFISECKDTWLQAQTANEKLKQSVQTQDADGMQVFSVSEAIYQHYQHRCLRSPDQP